MKTAARAFFSQLTDYAGLFPPALLPLPDALANYRLYRDGGDAWMLGRFIVPAARLAETGNLAGGWFYPEDPWEFSALGRGGADWNSFREGVNADIADMEAFVARFGESVRVGVYEVRLPPKSWTALAAVIGELLETLCCIDGLTTFIETGFAPYDTENWKRSTLAIIDELANDNLTRFAPTGLKVRCGGTTPDLFPTPEQIAWVIQLCRERRVPLKATAGLHHPVRHFNHEAQGTMHGFLNVFGAGVLAYAHPLERGVLTEIIADEESSHFRFDGNTFAWKELRADAATIAQARQAAVLSYGSCSFDEPRDDLRALGILSASGN